MYSKLIAVIASGLALSGMVEAQMTPVSQTTFNNIILYSKFSGASYAETCPTPPAGSSVLNYIFSPVTGAFATLFKYPAAKQLVLSFRGSATPQAFDFDLFFTPVPLNATATKCPGCPVHSGFQTAWNSISAQSISAVNSAKAANPGYTVLLTGHSLGGGIAAIASASLSELGNKLTVYTYGEPRNGGSPWTNYIQSLVPPANYFRVTHANDGVPQIPPTLFFFQHHGTEYWESRLGFDNTPATVFQCPGVEPANCNQAQSFGASPINGAHITYSNMVIGNSLNVVPCGATVP